MAAGEAGRKAGQQTMLTVESAGITDVGRNRGNNEDSLSVDDKQKLYIVADGMGGHRAGDVASKMVVEAIARHMGGDHGVEAEELMDPDSSLSAESNRLLAGIQLANRDVYHAAQEDESLSGMGSTVSVVYFTRDSLTAANVGDSPIYLVHEGAIEPLYVLHTVIAEQEAIDPDGMSEIEEQYRHMLTRAMGTGETVVTDACEVQYFRGDILVICSDGLSNMVSPEEILDVVSVEPPGEACRSMVDLANGRGGEDNITVIVVRVESAGRARPGTVGWLMGSIRRVLGVRDKQ